jgi:hypothetical protein
MDGVVHALALLASLAAAEGRVVEAIRVAAATTALSEQSGCPVAPFYRGGFERRLALSRQAVDPDIAAAAWADGWAMSQEQAVAAALAT